MSAFSEDDRIAKDSASQEPPIRARSLLCAMNAGR